jgi:hypothetical protein
MAAGRSSIRARLSLGLGIICAFAVATLVFTLFWEYDITPAISPGQTTARPGAKCAIT